MRIKWNNRFFSEQVAIASVTKRTGISDDDVFEKIRVRHDSISMFVDANGLNSSVQLKVDE
jgi:hypothetical protein